MNCISRPRCARRWASAAPNGVTPRAVNLQRRRCQPSAQVQEVQLQLEVVNSISKVSQQEWDEVATSGGELNPFLLWSFLHALEASGSAVPKQGWGPQHLLVRDNQGALQGVCPLYLKGHSYGEYVFDQSWANYSHMMGKEYYPKLQSCVPFTPVTGPRLLARQGPLQAAVVEALGKGLLAVAEALKVSSLHITFNTEQEWRGLAAQGMMQRTGLQYHWENQGYASFEDFLSALKQSKRKSVRQERKSVAKQGLTVSRLRGNEISSSQWDAFHQFYLATVDKRWGTAYLTREFFQMLGEALGDKVMLAVAHEGDELVAGALNLVGSHAIFGRNWGCLPGKEYKHLHFELCYYQALEEAIQRGLPRVEAGAQGEHKLQRGYLPSLTYSSHYVRDPQVRYAVAKFLDRERDDIDYSLQMLTLEGSPYKHEVTMDCLAQKLKQQRAAAGADH